MTPPIQEPSTPRDVSGLAWGERQLARRPAPPPPTVVGVGQWPMFYEVLNWDYWNNYDYAVGTSAFGNSNLIVGDVGASDYVNHWRFGDTRDNASFIAYLRLGPKGSIWSISFLADGGSDFGKVEFSWQTLSENATGRGYDLDGLGMLPGTTDQLSTLTWYHVPPAYLQDLYDPSPYTHRGFYGFSQFRIMGDDGAAITANATTTGDPVYHFDGGSGIWALRVRTNGKNASSSGYKIRLESIIVRRITSDGFYAG